MTDMNGPEGQQPSVPSQLTRQLQKEQTVHDAAIVTNGQGKSLKSPSRPRPWSSIDLKPALSPSPSFLEPVKQSKDDSYVIPNPVTPKRPSYPHRNLSLQMPPRDVSSSSTANLSNRVPLSPKPESSLSYGAAATVLPRRSRGLDFSRACTNLHHSTLAEQSSPDSSPVISGRGMMIPPRKNLHNGSSTSGVPDSPGSVHNSLWSTMANAERTGVSSSVGSANMMDSDSGSTSSADDDMMGHAEDEDTIHMTPQVHKLRIGLSNPFASITMTSPGGDGFSPFSPSTANLMSFQRARMRHGRSRKSSSSGHSSMASPGPVSPPLLKSIESSLNCGYFPKELKKKDVESRRESLSLGTNDLHISDGMESEDDDVNRISPSEGLGFPMPATPTLDERRSVIRKAVTRRGNLLPKPKIFARIRAALQEEGSPMDTEARREAEVIRQVRESDNDIELNPHHSQPPTTTSSPSLLPLVPGPSDSLEDVPDDEFMDNDAASIRRSSSTFTNQAIKNSAGPEFWNTFDERMRTPPPFFFGRSSSSVISDDVNMDTPASSVFSTTPQQLPLKPQPSSRSRSSTPQPPSMAVEVMRKTGKRRRDDDLDPNCFKRRAVSPGVSVQNSPILPPSPALKDGGWWGLQSKTSRDTPGVHAVGERATSGGSSSSANGPGLPKRIGLQGMTDTNDGLMNMSIE